MLQVDFNEEYIRFGRDLTENQLGFFLSNDNKLVFTTNIFTDNSVQLTSTLDIGNTNGYRNSTILVDSISLFTTNPNVFTYFPLKLTLNQKPSLEFTQPDIETIDKYTIYNEDDYILLNPDIISAKYVLTKKLHFKRLEAILNPVRLVASSSNPLKIYISEDANPDIPANKQYFIYDVATEEVTPVDALDEIFLDMKNTGSGRVSVMLQLDNAGNNLQWVDLHNDSVITQEPSSNDVQWRVFDTFLVILSSNQTDQVSIEYWLYSVNDGTPEWSLQTSLFNNNDPGLIDAVTDTINSPVYGLYIDGDYFIRLLSFDFNSEIYVTGNDLIQLTPTPVGEYRGMYYGGENKDFPIINIFFSRIWYQITTDNNNYRISSRPINIPESNEIDNLNIKRFYNQAYHLNTEYPPPYDAVGVDIKLIIYNMTTFQVLEFDPFIFDQNPNTKFNNMYVFEGVNIDLNGITFVGRNNKLFDNGIDDYVVNNDVVMFYFQNQRDTNPVYKVSFDYRSREFPFQLSSNELTLNISLNNISSNKQVNISSAEIFKIIMDVRIRYSLEKVKINPATRAIAPDGEEGVEEQEGFRYVQGHYRRLPDGRVRQERVRGAVSEGDEPVFRPMELATSRRARGQFSRETRELSARQRRIDRQARRVGGVEQILGYVDEDFSVADFLNIYTTR